ncbi:flagellar hook-length control protein FliK [Halomonas citrativorans]|uniref:Flagellar hook-length control protein FliK n=1 Tax=Halomonas citrativorans TaxID=2742612 RepID=A0ABR9FCD4_9GAMM|nr:flagellar hook-length control protein FliK [Halomonas citrativorans]MBE0403387.1 flagellar hook-length control protein FliK [Halomonas citrativorans]
MNIQLLLSGAQNQGSASMARSPLSASVDTPNLFRQALSQAANLPSTNAPLSANEAASQSQEQLASLQARLSGDSLAPHQAVDPSNSEPLTFLDEIAARMSLLASFAEPTEPAEALQGVASEFETLLQRLDLSQEQTAELLSALGIRPQPGMALEHSDNAIELLSHLSEEEAGQLVSALSVMLASTMQSSAGTSAAHKGPLGQAALSPPLLGQPLNSGAYRHDASSTLSTTNALPTMLDAANGQPTVVSSQDVFTKIGPLTSSAPLATPDELEPFLRGGQPAAAGFPNSASAGNAPAAASLLMPSSYASLGTPVSSPAWPSQLGQQLVQFAQRGGEQQIKMQLHPAELGPLSITLKVSEQGTQAHFLSSHMQVRQVVEQAIPQLREALAEQGISLGETSVGEQHNPNEQAFAEKGNNAGAQMGSSATDSDQDTLTPVAENVSRPLDGRVDLYA